MRKSTPRSFTASLLLAGAILLVLGCERRDAMIQIASLQLRPATASVEIHVTEGYLEDTLRVRLDGAAVEDSFTRTSTGFVGELPVSNGPHLLVAAARFQRGYQRISGVNARRFSRTPTPLLRRVEPKPAHVSLSSWLRLVFVESVLPEALDGFELQCDGQPLGFHLEPIDSRVFVVNPDGQLPPNASCALAWGGPAGPVYLRFFTTAEAVNAEVIHDRTDRRRTTPFPDDLWLVEDPTTVTGRRVQIAVESLPEAEASLLGALLEEVNRLDGWSPIGHFVVELSDAPDPSSLPLTPAQSLDPLASIGLFVLSGEGRGQRVPFQLRVREDTTPVGVTSHTFLLFPSIPLIPEERYGLVITRRVQFQGGGSLDPSAFFARVLDEPREGEVVEVSDARALVEPLLRVIEREAVPSIPRDDVALAVVVSIRSTREIPSDLAVIKQRLLALPPPRFEVTRVVPDPTEDPHVAAIVTGIWEAPEFREGTNLARDRVGRPFQTGSRPIPFVLALPNAALDGPVPITFYQHGNPGSAEVEVPAQARRLLAEAGFAVIGFTDTLNRETGGGSGDPEHVIVQQIRAFFLSLVTQRKLPDFWVQTNAEQLAFLHALEELRTLDLLPLEAPDGVPELDLDAPLTYLGVSEGANLAPSLLVQAPEIRAAALVAGGARRAELLIHQQAEAFIRELGALYAGLTPADIWMGVSLFQAIADRQDGHNHARFLYRDPPLVSGTRRKASILLVEGLGDSLVPNHATESLAYELGPLPHVYPVQRSVPFLPLEPGPLVGNVDAKTTAGFYQYTPLGVPGIEATPGCAILPEASAVEGHFCVQTAEEALLQLRVFFETALTNEAPTLINPLSP